MILKTTMGLSGDLRLQPHHRGNPTGETTDGGGMTARSHRGIVIGLGRRIGIEGGTGKDIDDTVQGQGPEAAREDTKSIGDDGINPGLRVDMTTAETDEITTDGTETETTGDVAMIDIPHTILSIYTGVRAFIFSSGKLYIIRNTTRSLC